MLFNEQFKMVEENGGVKQVKAEPDQLQTLAQDKMVVKESGFLYIYTSNESPQDVFFDNVILDHITGPVLEETHYYPFGLTMSGISSSAVGKLENKILFNGNELQQKEFTDGSGLAWYDFNARTYDQQTGRFLQIDPFTDEGGQEAISPYHFSYNNPIRFSDPDGKCPICPALPFIGEAIAEGIIAGGAAAGIVMVVDKAIDILKELPVPAGGANLTTVPLLPMPRE
ncbi:RHS repeat-associated core domain-containing protein [Chitinophaga niabensis]|uniref:RHS repeat domain-containing protein n=1 Tax=Chitinophaga niabensis TaxID=536979 RepID=UPI0031BBAD15